MGGPTVVALRPAVHGALLDAVGEHTVTLGCEVTGFSSSSDCVTLRAAGGDIAEGDLLVGADGAGSVIRCVLHPSEPPPRSSGLIAVRGAAHGAVQHLDGLSGIHYQGPGVESFVVRASDTGIYWALSLAEELVPAGMRHDPAAILRHMSPRFDEMFRAVTSGTTDMRVDELFDRDPLPFWGTDVVTLLGDAAHPVLPHTGQGAAQALVDAVALGRAVSMHADVEDALRAYERDRREKTAALVAQGRRTARIMGAMNPVACRLREVAVRLAPIKQLVRAFAAINRRAGTDVGR
jgi:2-polyprenyl-6-methoxyphenol hydroxylase-like FAD-dependent oxidoreductase